MQVHTRYFKWNHDFDLEDLKLGDSFNELVDKGIALKNKTEKGFEFKYHKNSNIWLGEKENKLQYIFFTNYSGNEIINVNVDKFEYPATDKICEVLSKHFDYLPIYTSLDAHKTLPSGDYLQLIFRDHSLSNMFIRRIQ